MLAALCRAHGRPDGIEVVEIDGPPLGPGQVRVAVDTAAVNFPDALIIANGYQIKVPVPFVPGTEFAGLITEIGDGVNSPAIGARVFGSVLVGAFAQEVVLNAGAVTPVPDGVALATAAAFGVAHRTSYHVLRSVAAIQPGEELLVLGAGGGVGLAAVQLGKHLGATVTAVASTDSKLAAARSCGADRLINYRDHDLRQALREDVGGGIDVVVDPVGGDLSEAAVRGMRRGGRFVTVGYASGSIPRIPLNLVLLKGVAILGFEFLGWAVSNPDAFARNEDELLDVLASGKAAPYVERRFPLTEAGAALQLVADGAAIGKVLLDIGST